MLVYETLYHVQLTSLEVITIPATLESFLTFIKETFTITGADMNRAVTHTTATFPSLALTVSLSNPMIADNELLDSALVEEV